MASPTLGAGSKGDVRGGPQPESGASDRRTILAETIEEQRFRVVGVGLAKRARIERQQRAFL
jgi:hypothetical protein